MKKTDQISRSRFLEKCGSFSLYDIDMKNRYTIDHKYIWFIKKYWFALIGNPDHLDGTLADHEYFFIHDDLFDQILATILNNNIELNQLKLSNIIMTNS